MYGVVVRKRLAGYGPNQQAKTRRTRDIPLGMGSENRCQSGSAHEVELECACREARQDQG